jgi:hypothetical protein
MKNTLAENMRRFGTKNLTEKNDLPTSMPIPVERQSLYLWVTEWAVPRGFKLIGDKDRIQYQERIWQLKTARGQAEIRMRIPSDVDIESMDILVTRSGVSTSADDLYTVTVTPEEFTKERMLAIQRQLEPYIKR